MKLTWDRNVFEKLIFHELAKELLTFYESKFRYSVHKSPPLEPTLSELNLGRIVTVSLLKICFNIIFPSTLSSRK